MTLSTFCHKKGMSIDEYKALKSNISSVCTAIIAMIPSSKKGNGLYFEVNQLLPYNTDQELRPYYISELKKQGVEFIDNNALWRY